ncbi:MAG TPA: alpha/beta hydrolase [Lacipirellulaceae bacterium]|nr:alpha/beta hydrolase [Lacipirellulaceae bacterium]
MPNLRRLIEVCLIAALSVAAAATEAAVPSTAVLTEPASSPAACLLNAGSAHGECQDAGYRAWLRRKVVRESDLTKYGLHLDDGWDKIDPAKPVVIMIHGFNSSPEQNVSMMIPIRAAGFPCGTFAYPNDYFIRSSAQLLSGELRKFSVQNPQRKVILICHSMGGLVARACVEDSLYDPGNVERLVLIAPPTHGTFIAHFAVGTDLWEHWLSRSSGWPWQRMRDSIVDGLGEAANDLCPDSEFLKELNARPVNPHVRYTILLGTGARLHEAQVDWIRHCVCESMAKMPGGEKEAKDLDSILADIDELVEGKGDGIVAVKRGTLDGVPDTLTMPFGHLAVTGDATTDLIRNVQHVVLERVR